MSGGYSPLAEKQLDAIEDSNSLLDEEVLRTCEHILDTPGEARHSAEVLTTAAGMRYRTSVPGHRERVFWYRDDGGAVIDAVFAYGRP